MILVVAARLLAGVLEPNDDDPSTESEATRKCLKLIVTWVGVSVEVFVQDLHLVVGEVRPTSSFAVMLLLLLLLWLRLIMLLLMLNELMLCLSLVGSRHGQLTCRGGDRLRRNCRR